MNGKCGQTMYVLIFPKVLRSHGMNDAALKDIYKPVVLAKLLYASPAWWGFATESDKHRIEAFVRQGVRYMELQILLLPTGRRS